MADKAERMRKQGPHILKLNIGNPALFYFQALEEIVTDIRYAIAQSERCPESREIVTARKVTMQYTLLKSLPNISMKDIYTKNQVSKLL